MSIHHEQIVSPTPPMTRSQLLALMTQNDLIHDGYRPPDPASHHYESRLAQYRQRVAIARRDAEQTLLLIEAAEGATE